MGGDRPVAPAKGLAPGASLARGPGWRRDAPIAACVTIALFVAGRRHRLASMPRCFSRFLVLCAVLALASTGLLTFRVSPAHAHDARLHTQTQSDRHHRNPTDCPGCPSCCLGACAGMTALPPLALDVAIPANTARVVYWLSDRLLPSRNIPPDPAPPRTIA
jgi:hypothetical protein